MTVTVAREVVCVACEGKLIPYDAKTLKKLAEPNSWEARDRGRGGRTRGG